MFEINIVCLPTLTSCHSFKLISFFGKLFWPLSLGRPSLNEIFLFSQNDYDLILWFAVISPALAQKILNLYSRESIVSAPLMSRLVLSCHLCLCTSLQPCSHFLEPLPFPSSLFLPLDCPSLPITWPPHDIYSYSPLWLAYPDILTLNLTTFYPCALT